MATIAERITEELQTLVGKPLWDSWRATDMQIFEFGARHPIINRKGELVDVGEVRLHIQCRWRIVDDNRILFGRDDLNYPANNSIPLEEFDWDKDASILDVTLRTWFEQHNAAPPKVVAAHGDCYGGFQIRLESGFILEAFPCESRRADDYREHWRLLGHRTDQTHFVVTGDGIERIEPGD